MGLTEAERLLRAHADDTVPVPVLSDKERTAIVLVLAEYDRRGAIEQRATMVAGEGSPVLSGDPSPQQAAVTARYILTGESR